MLTIYLEIAASANLAHDEQGNPSSVGLNISTDSPMDIPYEELISLEIFNLDEVAAMLHIKREEITIITPEEYIEKYGDEEGDEE